MNILLEVNISGEESKFGLRDDTEILEIAKADRRCRISPSGTHDHGGN